MAGLALLLIVALLSWLTRSAAPFAVYVMAVLVITAWRSRDGTHLAIYRRLSPAVFAQSALVLVVVAASIAGLLSLHSPVLNFSWFGWLSQRLDQGQLPVPGLAPGAATPGAGGDVAGEGAASLTGSTTNLLMVPLFHPWLIAPFVLLLAFLLPRLALTEERLFRAGTRDWRRGVVRSVLFGLAHLSMGIPLGAALGLSIGGLWFTYQYFRGGVPRSTIYHLAYNVIALIVIVLVMLAQAL